MDDLTQTSTQTAHPIQLEVALPERFARVQLFVRALVLVGFGVLQQGGVGLFGGLYFLLPVVAAVLITHRSGAGYLKRDAPWLVSTLEWVVGFYAFMLFVTDAFPLDRSERALRLRVTPCGTPTVGSAVLRLIASLPLLFIMMLLGLASFTLAVLAAVGILLFERYPAAMQSFQLGVVTWIARLLGYHASLVDAYPPFRFDDASMTRAAASGTEPRAGDAEPALEPSDGGALDGQA